MLGPALTLPPLSPPHPRGRLGRWALVMLLLALAGTVAAAPRPPSRAPIESLLRTGQYEKARHAADLLAGKRGAIAQAAIFGARAERALGLYEEARRRLEHAAIVAPDDLPLRAELVLSADALGDRGAVKDLVNRSYDEWERGHSDHRDPAVLVAMAVISRHDNNFEDANVALRNAVRADPKRTEANLEWGDLFLEKHNAGNALACFKDVLALDPQNPEAHFGLARVLLEQGYDSDAADREIDAVLAVNPRHPGALALRAQVALDSEQWDAVAAAVTTLRRSNPRDPGAAWLAGARALLLEDRAAFESERDRRLETRPADAGFFLEVSEALVRQRRYEEARQVAADGVDRDGTAAALLASYGNTLLRLGEEDQGLALLRRAWERDSYDVRTFNLLNLFEKVIPARYVTFETKHLRFRVETGQRPVIETVVAPFLEQTYDHYVARYGFRPRGPIVFELYTAAEHYAVRTVGLPRLGVAGVCFGRVITSRAPSAGTLNWGMVLSHELAHVFALQLSRSRVPRWFTEGLSELETAHLRPEWRRQEDLELGATLAAGRLPPIAGLSQAFLHARDDRASALAYMQASAVIEFSERRFGFPAIRGALEAYGKGERGPGVLTTLSKLAPAALEEAFRADLSARLAPITAQFLPATVAHVAPAPDGPAETPAALAEQGLRRLFEGARGDAQRALALARARAGGKDDPTVALLAADIDVQTGNVVQAAAQLRALEARGLRGYDLELPLGLCALRRRDDAEALLRFRGAVALAPGSVEAKTLLAEHLGTLGREDERLAVETEIVRLEPQTASLAKRVTLGQARAGRAGIAAEIAEMALFIQPDDGDLYAARGRALFATGRTQEAAQVLEQGLVVAPSAGPALHKALADVYQQLGEGARAAQQRVLAAPAR